MLLATFCILCIVIITTDLSIFGMVAAVKRQQPLELRLEAGTLEYANPEYIGPNSYFRVSRKSRNSPPVLNALFPTTRELPMDTNITWQCFQKVNNAWKPTIIKGMGQLCDILQSKNKLQRMLFEHSNMPSKCPVKKGNYTVKDFTVSSEGLPPVIPGSDWKAHCTWGIPKGHIISYTIEVKLDRKNAHNAAGSDAAVAEAVVAATNKD